jgi:bifunctional UDP-N-acetylglucosamine pyrophosphorylase/glucosamine-1-phosphate N-acetyltransferase
MVDPERTYIDTTVSLAADVTIFPDVILQGRTAVGEAVEIGPNTRLVDCAVGARARLEQTTGRDAEVGPDAVVGPFAYLPPGSTVASGLVTGSFYTAPLTED